MGGGGAVDVHTLQPRSTPSAAAEGRCPPPDQPAGVAAAGAGDEGHETQSNQKIRPPGRNRKPLVPQTSAAHREGMGEGGGRAGGFLAADDGMLSITVFFAS